MQPQRTVPLLHLAQGLLMGGADVIPGVSGGTMALIVGIYERLLRNVSAVFHAIVSPVRGGAAVRQAFGRVEWGFLLSLGLGIVTAIVVGSKVIPGLLERYPEEARALFLGLVAASVAIPWIRMRERGIKEYVMVPVAAVLAFVLVGLPPAEVSDPSLVRVFFSAAVAICAMILPGVSGAFLLAVLGMYTPTLHALSSMDVAYVLTFCAGAAVGLGAFSRLLTWLLEHQHDLTMAALVGLMAGSLRALWPWQDADRTLRLPGAGEPLGWAVGLALAGFALVTLLTWWGHRRIEAAATPRQGQD
jgi:putative membrane protein